MGKHFEDIFGLDSNDYFDSIIEIYGLKPSYSVYQNNLDEIIIDEQWKSDESKDIKANRIFKFDILFLDFIKEDCRIDVLNKVIDILVLNENYEDAALIRDVIKYS